MKIAILVMIGLFAFSMAYVYAYEETVQLPSGDYLGWHAYAIVWNSHDWEWHMVWGYGDILQSVEYPRNGTVVLPDIDADDPVQNVTDKVTSLIAKMNPPADSIGIDDSIDATVVTPEDITADEKILDDFEKCFGGQEQAGAFQQEYSIQKFEAVFKRFLSGDDKLAQECIAILKIRNASNAAYPGMEIDGLGEAKTIIPELKMSKGTQVDKDKLEDEQKRIQYPPWYQNPYKEWTGVNRGNSEPVISEDAYVNLPDKSTSGKTAKQILEEYNRKKAADITTEQDIRDFNADLDRIICETAWKTSGYGGLDISKWRIFLSDGWCNDKLDGVYFKGELWDLADVIEHKLEQSQTEARQDLRTHK